jgi:predicted Zn-dependent protease
MPQKSWKPTAILMALSLAWVSPAAPQAEDYRTRAHSIESQTTTDDDVAAEIRFGKDIAARVLGRVPLYDSPQLTRYVNLVGKAVAMNSSRPELEFRFAVLDSDQVNAYSAPGGYIFITRGALALVRDEAELAAVLAHEIAHVTEKHIVREFNIRADDDSSLAGLSRLIGGSQDSARVAFAQAVDKAIEVLFQRGFKHQDELDSDRIATLLLAFSGYDPLALRRYLGRVNDLKGDKAKAVGTTHPPSSERLSRLDTLIAAEGLGTLKYPRAEMRFKTHALRR